MGRKAAYKFFCYLAIALTLLLSMFTILANIVEFFPPNRFFFINLLAFGLPILLSFTIISFIYWSIFKWKIAIIPFIAILCSLPFINRIYQFRSEKSIITNSTNNELVTIATYNMYGTHFDKEKMASIATYFAKLDTDIICLEEFSPPKSKNDSISLQTFFSQWPYYLAETKPGLLPICIFSKYPITNPHKINFLSRKNNFLYCDLLLPQTSIRLFVTHLQTTSINRDKATIKKAMDPSSTSHKLDKGQILNNAIVHFNQNAIHRQEQVDSLYTLINQSKTNKQPVIVCGDFNAIASQYAYKKIISTGLQDGFVQCGSKLASTYRYFRQLIRIDYILYSDDFHATAYQIFDWEMSDHKAVVMQFKQPNKTKLQ
ncbi:MAG: endonuclease/exonuclease/phosphatase family protein [Bacteroidaceae bacterium]